MAEVTYYYNVYGNVVWTDPDNIIDNNLETFGSTANDGDRQRLIETTCDGADLGTITKVEIRCYGYGDGDDRIDLEFWVGIDINTYPLTMPSAPGWSSYADVTNDSYIDGWTWADVAALSALPYFGVEYDKVGKGNTMYCAKVEIRVTYTPEGPPEKVTQYLAGLDCPEFPHEMDLLSDKLPCLI